MEKRKKLKDRVEDADGEFDLSLAREKMKMAKTRWVAQYTGKKIKTIQAYLLGTHTPDKSTAIAWALSLNLSPLSLWKEKADSSQDRKTA